MKFFQLVALFLLIVMFTLITFKVLRDNKIEKARQDAILYEKLKKDLEARIIALEAELSKKTQELVTAQSGANNAEEINALRALVAKMNEEIEQLRLQVGQVQKEKDDLNVIINASPFFTTPPREVILNDPVLQVILFMLFLTILLLGILLFTTRRQLFSTDSDLQSIFENKFNSYLESVEKEDDFYKKSDYLGRMQLIMGSAMYGSKTEKRKKLIEAFDKTIHLAQLHVFYLSDAMRDPDTFLYLEIPEKDEEKKIIESIKEMIVLHDEEGGELIDILKKKSDEVNQQIDLLKQKRDLIKRT